MGKEKITIEIQDITRGSTKKKLEASIKFKIPTVTFFFFSQKIGRDQKKR